MITLKTYKCKTVSGNDAVINRIVTDGKGVVEYATGYAWDDYGKTPGPMIPCGWWPNGTADGAATGMGKFSLAEE